MPNLCFPIPPVALSLPSHKIESPELINLRSAEFIHPEISNILNEISFANTDDIQYYPYLDGVLHSLSQQLGTDPARMTLSAGSDLMILILMEAIGTITGKIILQSPSYSSWRNYAILRKMDVTVVQFGQYQRHSFCLSGFIHIMKTSSPSLVAITNPHSPTGFCFSQDDILKLSACSEKYGHLLLIDACFSGFANIDHLDMIGSHDHVILIQSFSKSLGIAGARISLTIASEKITQHLSQWRPELSVSGQSVRILEHMLHCKRRVEQVYKEVALVRERFILELGRIKPHWKPLPSVANFVVFFLEKDCPVLFARYILNHGFRIGDLSQIMGLDGCIRITIAHWLIMADLLEIIKNYRQ